MPLRSCSAIRSRQYSLLAPIFFPTLALVMAPLWGFPDHFGRGVHRTLTNSHGLHRSLKRPRAEEKLDDVALMRLQPVQLEGGEGADIQTVDVRCIDQP